MDHELLLRVATTVVVYPDAAAANRAAAELRDPIPATPGFVNIPITEPAGAFGYRMWATEGGWPTNEWEGGYTWGVIFTRGPVLGRAWLEFGEVTPDAQARDRAAVEAAAARLATNVVEVLGVADRSPGVRRWAHRVLARRRLPEVHTEPGAVVEPVPSPPVERVGGGAQRDCRGNAVDRGRHHVCPRPRPEQTWCWGGSVLTGDESQFAIPTATPTRVADGRQMTRLSGRVASIVPAARGAGARARTPADPGVPAPAVPIGGDHRFTDLSVGEQTSCGLDGERQAWCWQSWADAGQVRRRGRWHRGPACPRTRRSSVHDDLHRWLPRLRTR